MLNIVDNSKNSSDDTSSSEKPKTNSTPNSPQATNNRPSKKRFRPKKSKKSVQNKSGWILAFSLFATYSLLLGSLVPIIGFKFTGKDPFKTHAPYFYVAIGAYIYMGVGFGIISVVSMVVVPMTDENLLYPTGFWYELLASSVAVCVFKVPLAMILVVLVPSHKLFIGYAIFGVFILGALFFNFRKYSVPAVCWVATSVQNACIRVYAYCVELSETNTCPPGGAPF
ncbi:hypothetical protein Tco_0414194 [Tanacetum coccineum]